MNLQQLVEVLCVKHDLVASDFLTEEDVTSLSQKNSNDQHPGTSKVDIVFTFTTQSLNKLGQNA